MKNIKINMPEELLALLDGGAKIDANLDLSGTQITSLPEGLSVGGSLYR